MKHWSDSLTKLRACEDARAWAKTQPTFKEAWQSCERGDWMLWLAGKMADKENWPTHQQVVLAACDCAELAFVHLQKGETRPQECIAVVRRWAEGKATIEEVRRGRDAAYAAYAAAAYAVYAYAADADAADAAYAAYAAYAAAAYAVYAADADADAADAAAAAADADAAAAAYAVYAYAADAAAADAAAADAAAAAYARKKTLAQCAEIVRKRLIVPELLT